MDYIKRIYEIAYEIANIPIQLFDYTITLWQIFIFVVLGTMLVSFIRKLFE